MIFLNLVFKKLMMNFVSQVYMSSSGLDWCPIFAAWLKHRHPTEVSVFQHLFDESFPVIYAWSVHGLNFVIKILQCNIIQQVITIYGSI